MFSINSLPNSLPIVLSLYFLLSSLQSKLVMWKDIKSSVESFWLMKLYTPSKPPKNLVWSLNLFSQNPLKNSIEPSWKKPYLLLDLITLGHVGFSILSPLLSSLSLLMLPLLEPSTPPTTSRREIWYPLSFLSLWLKVWDECSLMQIPLGLSKVSHSMSTLLSPMNNLWTITC